MRIASELGEEPKLSTGSKVQCKTRIADDAPSCRVSDVGGGELRAQICMNEAPGTNHGASMITIFAENVKSYVGRDECKNWLGRMEGRGSHFLLRASRIMGQITKANDATTIIPTAIAASVATPCSVSMPKPNLTMTKSSVTQKTRATILLRNLIVASHRKAWANCTVSCVVIPPAVEKRMGIGAWMRFVDPAVTVTYTLMLS